MTPYDIAAMIYGGIAVATVVPCVWPLIFGTNLYPGGPLFEQSPHFDDDQRQRLQQNYERIKGTLKFWKGKATGYTRIHYYCVIFTILSSWAVPLISAIVQDTSQAKWLILVVSSHIALALSFHKGLNVSENMQVFRHGESEFYDLSRRLLDTPEDFGEESESQIQLYCKMIADLRRFVRRQETERAPSVEKNGANHLVKQ